MEANKELPPLTVEEQQAIMKLYDQAIAIGGSADNMILNTVRLYIASTHVPVGQGQCKNKSACDDAMHCLFDCKALANQAAPQEPIYQVAIPLERHPAALRWYDVKKDQYDTSMPDLRRIVYTAPQPAPAPAVAVGALTDEKIRQLAVDHGVIAFHPDPKLTAFARALIADQSARAPAGEPVADIIALADWFKRERPSGMHATLFRNAEAKLRALATSAAPVANAGQAQDDGQQHDDPTGPNHPGHHDGMTCERAAQVIVDLTEDQYPGSRGNFSNRIKRVYGESEYASWKPQAAQPTGGERAAFEAEMQRIGYNMTMEAKKPGQYAFPPMRAAWHAWQARAAISAQQKP